MASPVSRAGQTPPPEPNGAPEQPAPSKLLGVFEGVKKAWNGVQALKEEKVVLVTNAQGISRPVKKATWASRFKQIFIGATALANTLGPIAVMAIGIPSALAFFGAIAFTSPLTAPFLGALACAAALFFVCTCLGKLISLAIGSKSKEPSKQKNFLDYLKDFGKFTKTITGTLTPMTVLLGTLAMVLFGWSAIPAVAVGGLLAIGIYYLLQNTIYKENEKKQESDPYEKLIADRTSIERLRQLTAPKRREDPSQWVTPKYA